MKTDALDEKTQDDFGKLLGVYIGATLQIVSKQGSVLPMAVALEKDGPVFKALQLEDEGKNIDMEQHLQAYRTFLSTHCKDAIATLLGYDIRLKSPDYKDGICCELTHQNGTKVKVVQPYSRNKLTKKVKTGAMLRFEV
jgi:hypothetical protein